MDNNNFNYQTEAEKIARQRAIANMLIKQSQSSPQGQFFSNGAFTGYAGGATPLTAIAQALTAYLGKSAMDKADTQQSDLDKRSREAFTSGIDHLNDQVDMSPDEAMAADQLARRKAIAQADAQMMAERQQPVQQPQQVQVSPTQPATTPPQPVAPAAPVQVPNPAQVARAFKAQSNPVESGRFVPGSSYPGVDLAQQVRDAKADSTVSAADIAALPPALTGGAPAPTQSVAPVVKQGLSEKDKKSAVSQLKALTRSEVSSDPVASVNAEQSPLGSDEYNYNDTSFTGPMEPAVSHKRDPSQSEKWARIMTLAQSGPLGAAYADQEIQKLGAKAHEFDLKDGYMFDKKTGAFQKLEGRSGANSETIDTPNGLFYRDGTPVLGKDGKQLMGKAAAEQNEKTADTEASYQQSKADFGVAASRLGNILSSPEMIKNAAGGVWNNIKGALPVPTDQSEARSSIKEAASGMVMGAIKSMKTAGVGTGAFNSDAESARLQAALADIDFNHIGEDALRAKLNSLYTQSQDALARLEAARGAKVPEAQQTNPHAKVGGRGVFKFD